MDPTLFGASKKTMVNPTSNQVRSRTEGSDSSMSSNQSVLSKTRNSTKKFKNNKKKNNPKVKVSSRETKRHQEDHHMMMATAESPTTMRIRLM